MPSSSPDEDGGAYRTSWSGQESNATAEGVSQVSFANFDMKFAWRWEWGFTKVRPFENQPKKENVRVFFFTAREVLALSAPNHVCIKISSQKPCKCAAKTRFVYLMVVS